MRITGVTNAEVYVVFFVNSLCPSVPIEEVTKNTKNTQRTQRRSKNTKGAKGQRFCPLILEKLNSKSTSTSE